MRSADRIDETVLQETKRPRAEPRDVKKQNSGLQQEPPQYRKREEAMRDFFMRQYTQRKERTRKSLDYRLALKHSGEAQGPRRREGARDQRN